jgi:hypothetical protein
MYKLENCNSGKMHILKFRCVMFLMMHCKKCRFQIKLISVVHFGEITLVLIIDIFFVLSSLIFSQSEVIKVMA